MTRWTHDEVRDLYRRAERAEEALLRLVASQLDGKDPEKTTIEEHSPLHDALVLLTKQGRTHEKEHAQSMLNLYPVHRRGRA